MRLVNYLQKNQVLEDLHASTKKEVLAELLLPLAANNQDLEFDSTLTILQEREQLGTTGIGGGVAIPHGKVDGLPDILLSVGRSRTGVAFDALDNQPCHIFFLVLAPGQAAGMHLRILAQISKLLKDEHFRMAFLDFGAPESLYDLLANY